MHIKTKGEMMRIRKKDYKSVSDRAKETGAKVKVFLFAAAIFFLTVISGCGGAREKEIPGPNVAGIRTTIQRILISPLAFDGAVVAVEGIARESGEVSEENRQTITEFELSDIRGNFINVSAPGKQSISENDALIVGGIYRREKNEIEARQIERIVESQ